MNDVALNFSEKAEEIMKVVSRDNIIRIANIFSTNSMFDMYDVCMEKCKFNNSDEVTRITYKCIFLYLADEFGKMNHRNYESLISHPYIIFNNEYNLMTNNYRYFKLSKGEYNSYNIDYVEIKFDDWSIRSIQPTASFNISNENRFKFNKSFDISDIGIYDALNILKLISKIDNGDVKSEDYD